MGDYNAFDDYCRPVDACERCLRSRHDADGGAQPRYKRRYAVGGLDAGRSRRLPSGRSRIFSIAVRGAGILCRQSPHARSGLGVPRNRTGFPSRPFLGALARPHTVVQRRRNNRRSVPDLRPAPDGASRSGSSLQRFRDRRGELRHEPWLSVVHRRPRCRRRSSRVLLRKQQHHRWRRRRRSSTDGCDRRGGVELHRDPA